MPLLRPLGHRWIALACAAASFAGPLATTPYPSAVQGLVLDNVGFAYPRRGSARQRGRVLEGVSAEIPLGQVTVVVGPNGAGKSTLLRLMLGALRPDSGRVRLDGQDVAAISPARRAARLAYVPQRAELSEAFSVRQTVRLGRHALGPDESAVEAALRGVDLLDRADDPLTTLSAGQQQRATLARALAQLASTHTNHPRVLLADEPMSALDPAHVLSTITLLRDFAAHPSHSVVVVVHDLTAALRLADHALVLDATGRLAAAGPTPNVLTPAVLDPVFGVRFRHISDLTDAPGTLAGALVAAQQGGRVADTMKP